VKSEAEDVLTDLVLMRSTSEDPAQPIIDYVSHKLRRLGIEPRHFGSKERPAMVASFHQGGVVLSGHLDTVPHGTGWKRDQAEIVDGIMYGRGACDMKGGCTAMLLAAQELVAANVPFSLCFTTDEETTMDGAAAAAKDMAFSTAPAVLITEPSNFEIVVKEKGLLHFSISTKGKAAHASLPHLGENAIAKMVGLLSRLEDLQKIPEDPLSEMTMCVDTIKGGTRINVIPGDCEVEIDVRYPPNMNTKAVLDLVRARVGSQGYEVKILHELDPVETDPGIPAVTTLKGLIGPGAKIAAVPYATEMVQFKLGNPAVMVCGPGEPAMCHIIDERIEISQIVRAAELYVEYCSRMSDR
jgi:acetylornithine deacetylase/succinyl-diaminopimelate desuccinylase-like protein